MRNVGLFCHCEKELARRRSNPIKSKERLLCQPMRIGFLAMTNTMNFISLFPTIDLFILFLFAVVFLLDLIFVKKEKLFVDFIAIYTAFILIIVVPMFSTKVSGWLAMHELARLGAFLVVKFGLIFALWHSNLGEFSKKVTPTQTSTSLFYRLGLMGLFFTTIIYFLPETWKLGFGNLTNTLFNNFLAMVVWFFIPLLFAFAYRFKTRRGWVE